MIAAVGIKRLGFAVAGLGRVGIGALVIVPFLMPAEAVREAVKAEIRAVTGLDPVLRGAASVSLFPTGTVSFDDVSLGDNRTGAPALTAERVVARLRFFPFLSGRIEIADVSLVRPTIAVIFNADRSSNWSRTHRNAGAKSQAQSGQDVIILGNPDRGRDRHPARRSLQDRRDALERGIRARVALDLARALPPPAVSPGATSRSTPASASPTSSPRCTATDPGSRSGSPAAPFKFAFDGYISHRPTLKMEGTLAADAASLRDAMRWAGQQPPPGGGFGRFALKAQTNVVGGTIGLSGVNVELDGNSGEGVLTLRRPADAARNARSRGARSDALRLHRPPADQRRARLGRKPIALDGFDGIDIDLRLSAARVNIANAKLGRTAVAANLRGGNLTRGGRRVPGLRRRGQGNLRARQVVGRRRLQGPTAILQRRSRAMHRRDVRHPQARGQRQSRLRDRQLRPQRLRPDQGVERHRRPHQPQGCDRRIQCRAIAQAHRAPAALGRRRVPHRENALRDPDRQSEDHRGRRRTSRTSAWKARASRST